MQREYGARAPDASGTGGPARALMTDELERLVREGARRMVAAMLEA